MEPSSHPFTDLSQQHQRSSSVAQRRILLLALLAAAVTAAVLAAAIDVTRVSPARRYATAVATQFHNALHCDDALGRRRMWLGDVVTSRDLCAVHADESTVRAFPDANLSFLVIGDWGRDGMCCQRDVAAEMALAAEKVRPAFVVSVGDNFYDDGIQKSTDTQIDRSWRGVYIEPYEVMRSIPWKVILGNHDYQGTADAQTVLSKKDNLWHMPKPYYFETVKQGDVFMAFLDTTVLYYNQTQMHRFKGANLGLYHRDIQVAALKKALSESKARWKLVFGHHALFSSGENGVWEEQNLKQLRTMLLHILRENKVAAYFSGHEHTLEHLRSNGVNFFVSGGGSKITKIAFNLEESVFTLNRQGHMVVSVRSDPEELHVQVVDLEGSVVHTARVPRPED